MTLEKSGIDLEVLTRLKTPCYIYSQKLIQQAYDKLASMENAYGLEIRYAMKANSSKALLKILKQKGAKIDASSLNEALRAQKAGYTLSDITYTTQEITEGTERQTLFGMVLKGMKFNVSSRLQYRIIRQLAIKQKFKLSLRIHPGIGSGQSITRDTGSDYSCFGVHLRDLAELLKEAEIDGVQFDEIHVHIGSGGKKETWLENVKNQLIFARKYFKNLKKIDFGGGLKVARMPQQLQYAINVKDIELQMKRQMLQYGEETKTRPITVIQPGTFLLANSGFIVTKVIDKKSTRQCNFLILNGGMELNTRPLLYCSKHPFYVVSKQGKLLSSEWNIKPQFKEFGVVGRCCESGDSQSLHEETKRIMPRKMQQPEVGDLLIIGGAGAYCSSMSPFNYNSHVQSAQYLFDLKGEIRLIRRAQTLDQIIQNQTDELLKP